MKNSFLFLLLIWAFACTEQSDVSQIDKSYKEALFTEIAPANSGIDFVHAVVDQADFNILSYRNFYNGGGVALGDVNNDGLVDIYFTSNQDENKLYLNKGSFQFEDITASAGVSGRIGWSTGVTMVDINSDGWLDIYVCNSGDIAGLNRGNELFINQQDGSFVESAAIWNLANKGYSTHASFFDFDQDGDLDCYILNNSFKSPDKIELYKRSRLEQDLEGGDKLLRNDGGIFVDVTHDAGIFSSDIGFGLGLSIGDLNGDMLPDIYVSNDFWERDYFYRNIGKGKFVEELKERFDYVSLNSMGGDIGDLNNDGLPDIMTTDMLPADSYRRKTMTHFDSYRLMNSKDDAGYHVQLMQNALHMNQGQGNFSEVAYQKNLAATDWSWGSLFFDFNNDGWKDIFISNGIAKDLTNFDFVEYITDQENVKAVVEENKRADFRDYLEFMPSTPLSNYGFLNNKGKNYSNESVALGLATLSFSNGSAYGDLDNDGDLDLVVSNVNSTPFIYQNTSDKKGGNFLKIKFQGGELNPLGIGAKVIAKHNNQIQVFEHFLSRGFQSSVAPDINIGIGEAQFIDSLIVIWPDLKMQILTEVRANQVIGMNYANANERYIKPNNNSKGVLYQDVTEDILGKNAIHKENDFDDFDKEVLLPYMLSKEGPEVIVADVNNDQLEDFLLLGGVDDPTKLFIQNESGGFDSPFQEAIYFDQGLEATCAAFFDYDKDGDLDLVIGHGGNELEKGRTNFGLRFYKNDGTGLFSNITDIAPPAVGNLSSIKTADVDNDGDEDLFFGGRSVPGNYGLIPASYLVLNEGSGSWADVTFQEIGQVGMVTGSEWSDVDNDGDMDLIVVGEWMPVTIFENEDGLLTTKNTIPNSSGWWQDIEAVDLDGDGDMDFVLGNWGENTFFQASTENPLKMYVKDFDNNGKSEFIIEAYDPIAKSSYPVASRSDILQQLPGLRKGNISYEAYAKKGIKEIFSKRELSSASVFTVETLKSSIIWNTDDGLILESLPDEAQSTPIFSSLVDDFNGDGQLDLLLGGNAEGMKPEFGRAMGSKGILLEGDGDKSFSWSRVNKLGISISGAVRDIKIIETIDGQSSIVIGVNDKSLRIYRSNQQ